MSMTAEGAVTRRLNMVRVGVFETDWNEDRIAQLRQLWAEGHTCAEIGRRMRLTKNAIVGKVHRLNLPRRPNPIVAQSSVCKRRNKPKRSGAVTLAPIVPHAALPVAAPAPVVAMMPISPVRTVTRECSWPIGEPRTKSFRYCDAETVPGKSYCCEHMAVAYVRRVPRQPALFSHC